MASFLKTGGNAPYAGMDHAWFVCGWTLPASTSWSYSCAALNTCAQVCVGLPCFPTLHPSSQGLFLQDLPISVYAPHGRTSPLTGIRSGLCLRNTHTWTCQSACPDVSLVQPAGVQLGQGQERQVSGSEPPPPPLSFPKKHCIQISSPKKRQRICHETSSLMILKIRHT